jgi:hypothetical protein
MFDKILSTIALALIDYLLKRIERGSVATDADRDVNGLRLGGDRIRDWMQSNGASSRVKPDPSRTIDTRTDLHPD